MIDARQKLNLTRLGNCPACKSTAAKNPRFKLRHFSVYICPACGLRYVDPSLDGASQMLLYNDPELLKEINPALENYYEYETLNPKSRTYADYSKALTEASKLTSGRRLLEAGCGTGSFLKFAATQGWDVTGVDSGDANIRAVREAGLKGICSGFLEMAGNDVYDCVVLWDLIEHPQDPVLFVEKAKKLLAPGGLLLIATPQYPNLLTVIAETACALSGGKITGPLEKLYILEHVTYFGTETLDKLVRQSGLQTARVWKTETDLARYRFTPLTSILLRTLFFAARLLGLQNRVLLIARKA